MWDQRSFVFNMQETDTGNLKERSLFPGWPQMNEQALHSRQKEQQTIYQQVDRWGNDEVWEMSSDCFYFLRVTEGKVIAEVSTG